jgi:hypothetical protein
VLGSIEPGWDGRHFGAVVWKFEKNGKPGSELLVWEPQKDRKEAVR